jgi:FK506-binding protein 6
MKRGEIAIITTTPTYAFGKLGCPPRIPGNVDLEFEIELLRFERKRDRNEFSSLEDRIAESLKDKEEGNEHFKKGHFRKAAKCYNKVTNLQQKQSLFLAWASLTPPLQ